MNLCISQYGEIYGKMEMGEDKPQRREEEEKEKEEKKVQRT